LDFVSLFFQYDVENFACLRVEHANRKICPLAVKNIA